MSRKRSTGPRLPNGRLSEAGRRAKEHADRVTENGLKSGIVIYSRWKDADIRRNFGVSKSGMELVYGTHLGHWLKKNVIDKTVFKACVIWRELGRSTARAHVALFAKSDAPSILMIAMRPKRRRK